MNSYHVCKPNNASIREGFPPLDKVEVSAAAGHADTGDHCRRAICIACMATEGDVLIALDERRAERHANRAERASQHDESVGLGNQSAKHERRRSLSREASRDLPYSVC